MTIDDRFTAIALAGGRLERDFVAAGYRVPNKAYLKVGGVTMLERVLRALRGARSVGRIRCVTQPAAFEDAFGGRGAALCDDVIDPGADLIDSLLAGFAGLAPDAKALVVATDIPLVTARALDSFAADARAAECDVGYGFVRKEPHVRRYPRVRHTWVRLREGTFCGGGVSMLRAGAAVRAAALLRSFAAARKSPLRLAMLFSPLLVARLVLGLVSVAELERRAGELSGLRCRGIASDEPVLAVNVDRLEDLAPIEEIVGALNPPA